MRCPKCGFISFDHLTSCAKCGKDVAEVASELQGTSIKVEAPMFLGSALAAHADRAGSIDELAMEDEESAGVDFSMEEEVVEEAAADTADTGEEVDFSFDEAEPEAEISMAGDAPGGETAAGAPEESFEELDVVAAAEEDEEGGLEFDLDDFIVDLDEEK
jgi:hypothetical protein